jgi:4-amino-4-deoxy-L-arabinose transferase-like glycosyltransferase
LKQGASLALPSDTMTHTSPFAPRVQLQRADWVVLSVCVFIHGWIAAATNLSVDEAHYALYGALPDWSYFDHPPLVGWLQWPFAHLDLQLGGSDFVMRITAMSSWVLSAWLLMRLTQTLFPVVIEKRVWGIRADLLLYALSILPHLLGLAWVPDTALTVIACALALLCWRIIQSPRIAWGTGVALGLWLGLAGLTKYTAVLLAVGVLWVFLLNRTITWRNLPPLILSVVMALLCITPVLYWNMQHDWISFAYQLHHAQGDNSWHGLFATRYALVLWLCSGLIFPWALWVGVRQYFLVQQASDTSNQSQAIVFLFALALPSVSLLAWASGHGNALPHWSVPALTLLIPVASIGLIHISTTWIKLSRALIHLQLLIVVGFMLLLLIGDWQGASSASKTKSSNPFADLYGWQDAARMASTLATEHNTHTLAVMNWTLASRLAWYARPLPVKVLDARVDQFDLWFGQMQTGENAIVLNWSEMPQTLPTQTGQFAQCQPVAQLPVWHWGRQLSTFDFYLCTNWQDTTGDH